MGESVKAICQFIVLAATITAAVAWYGFRPSEKVWIVRISASAIAILFAVILLLRHFRADYVPDYLYERVGNYFNRDGFCFSFAAKTIDDICYIEAHFQNQRDRPCFGRIALRPKQRTFTNISRSDAVTFEIDCAPAAFGVARVAVPLRLESLGQLHKFEVGASVSYPTGKGRRLRFREGIFLRANADFGNAFGKALTIAGALAGAVIWTTPASVTLQLPAKAADRIPRHRPETETIWQLGDAPLQDV